MIKFSKDKVLLLHSLLAEETGGSIGVRDEALLKSALESVFASFGGWQQTHWYVCDTGIPGGKWDSLEMYKRGSRGGRALCSRWNQGLRGAAGLGHRP